MRIWQTAIGIIATCACCLCSCQRTLDPRQVAEQLIAENRLADSGSPYLTLHADQPVHWQAWTDNTIAAARHLDRPIFLSIGYATCHWCHVMAAESFANPEIATMLNDNFISIKVDRERRPDLDQVYMAAVQTVVGRGGWPMSAVLTPEGDLYMGGTYMPPTAFKKWLQQAATGWQQHRAQTVTRGQQIMTKVRANNRKGQPLTRFERAAIPAFMVDNLASRFDPRWGGFGSAPKFPMAPSLELLIHASDMPGNTDAWQMLTTTANAMATGGIYDHLDGGFHRYSVDAQWRVPHFEKMLYDQAQLLSVYTQIAIRSTDPLFRRVANETANFVLNTMQASNGLFFSAIDAQSSQGEGWYYTWSDAEFIRAVTDLTATEQAACHAVFGINGEPEVDGRHVLAIHNKLQFASNTCRSALRQARRKRNFPAIDRKHIAAWNGMMITALADWLASGIADNIATRTQGLLRSVTALSSFDQGNGIVRSQFDDSYAQQGFVDDYAAIARAYMSTFRLTGDIQWRDRAIATNDAMIKKFWRGNLADFAYGLTDVGGAQWVHRADNAVPSANSLAYTALQSTGIYSAKHQSVLNHGLRAIGRDLYSMPFWIAHQGRQLSSWHVASTTQSNTSEPLLAVETDHGWKIQSATANSILASGEIIQSLTAATSTNAEFAVPLTNANFVSISLQACADDGRCLAPDSRYQRIPH